MAALTSLKNLTRHLMGNRRHSDRKRRSFDAIIKDVHNRIVFRGKTMDVSRTGARMTGFPGMEEPTIGLRVTAEFMVVQQGQTKWVVTPAIIRRVCGEDDAGEGYTLALEFRKT